MTSKTCRSPSQVTLNHYSAWKTETLRKLARALNVRLKITFETFGALLDEVEEFNRESLERPTPAEDAGLTQPKRRSVQTAVAIGDPAERILEYAKRKNKRQEEQEKGEE